MSKKASQAAIRLLEALREATRKRQRIELNRLWQVFDSQSPELRGTIHRRRRLAEQVRELAQAGQLKVPSTKRLGERHPSPALPHWVQLPKPESTKPARMNRELYPWAPELGFVATTPDADLLALQAFFRDAGRSRPLVPMRERSIRIFGHEKRLEALARTKLFTSERLTLEAISCYAMSPPLVWEPGPKPGLPLLVVENHHTWESLRRFNEKQATWSAVIYGAGKHVLSSAEFLQKLAKKMQTQTCQYFGDLDPEGVRILAQLTRECLRAGGPSVVPDHGLYGLLLLHGEPQKITGRSSKLEQSDLDWLGEALAAEVGPTFVQNKRWAQEWVGWEVLGGVLD